MPECAFCHHEIETPDEDGFCPDVFACWWRFLDQREATGE